VRVWRREKERDGHRDEETNVCVCARARMYICICTYVHMMREREKEREREGGGPMIQGGEGGNRARDATITYRPDIVIDPAGRKVFVTFIVFASHRRAKGDHEGPASLLQC